VKCVDNISVQSISHFEALSKILDAEELSALVRAKLKVDVDISTNRLHANTAKANNLVGRL
jgi:hypothetical protein